MASRGSRHRPPHWPDGRERRLPRHSGQDHSDGHGLCGWTGTSIAGATVVGICVFGESTTPLRLVSIALILAGVVGLRVRPNHAGAPTPRAGETRQK